MAAQRVRQVYIAAEQVDDLSAFIGDVLGFEQQFRDGDRWVQFRAGDISLAVAHVDEESGVPAGTAVPVVEVDDLDETLTAARSFGAQAGEVRDMGEHGRTVLLTLPGGAPLALMQR